MEEITQKLLRYVQIFDPEATEVEVTEMLTKTHFLEFFERVLETDDDDELEGLFDDWADPGVDLEKPEHYNHAISFAALICLANREPLNSVSEIVTLDDLGIAGDSDEEFLE